MKISPVYAVIAIAAVAIVALVLSPLGGAPAVPSVEVGGVPAEVSGVTLEGSGLLLLAVKDRPVSSEFGNITGIRLTVSKITAHFSSAKVKADEKNEDEDAEVAEDNETEQEPGWKTVFEGSKTFNLLNYVDNVLGVLGEANLSAGKYTEMRLYLTRSVIEFNGAPDGSGATVYRLTIPGNALKLKKGLIIRDNTTTLLTMDFNVNSSISVSEDEEFVLTPVIKILKEDHKGKDKSQVMKDKEQEGIVLKEIA